MARPKKEGMDYFSHDTDAVNDEKIEAMRTLFGNDGYAFYFILLERIYRSERGELDISNFTVKTVLISKLGIKAEQFEPMLEAAFEIGLFDRSMYSERSCLSSLGIKKRWHEIDKQRQKWRKKKGETTANNNIKEDNSNIPEGKPELSPEKGTQSKVKESKVNKKEINKELYTSEFESFWNHYPRKIGKQETAKVFQRLIKNKELPQVIIQCAANYKAHCKVQRTEERYIKHPKTFLNEERYKDYTNGGVENEKLTEHTQGLRHRGDQAKSEYDFLDSNNRTGAGAS